MENQPNDQEMRVLFDRFMGSFVPHRDPRMDLETNALRELKGTYLEKAKAAILERLLDSPDRDAIWSARAIHLTDAVPLMQAWLDEIRSNPASKYRYPSLRGELANALYEFNRNDEYVADLVEVVKQEGYGEFNIGVYGLKKMPLTSEGMAAVWNKYKKGKTIKEPHSWRDQCAEFLREKIREPVGERFLESLPESEKQELLEFIGESSHQRLERKFRLERYVYGRERFSKEDLNRYDEYIKVGGSPVKGLTLQSVWAGHTDRLLGLVWSPDGRYLASHSEDDTIRIWETGSGNPVHVFQQPKDYPYSRNRPQKIAWTSAHGPKITAVYSNWQTKSNDEYSICEWDISTSTMAPPLYGTTEKTPVNKFICLPDQNTFLLCYWNALFLWNRSSRVRERILEKYAGHFNDVALSPNGKYLAIACYELRDSKTGVEHQPGLYGENVAHEILIYELAANKVVHRFESGHIQGITSVCWMPNSANLAIASLDNSISVWDVQENRRVRVLESEGFVGGITGLSASADGRLLASTSEKDHLLRIWRTDTWDEVVALRELISYQPPFSFHPSLPLLASICALPQEDAKSSTAIRVWNIDMEPFLSNPPFMEEFRRRESDIREKLLLAETTEDQEAIKVGSSPARGITLRQVLVGHTDRIQQIGWSPDGRHLASSSDDKTLRIWDGETGTCMLTFNENDRLKRSAWAPNSDALAYGGESQIKILNLKTSESRTLLQHEKLRLDSLQFSPDGRFLAVAHGYNTILLFDTSNWTEVNRKEFDPHSNCAMNIQWSDDGLKLIVNRTIGFVHVLDGKTLGLIQKVAVPGDHTQAHVFTTAVLGNKVAVAEDKRPIMIFDQDSGQMEKEFADATSYTSGLAFSPYGEIVASWCHDNSVYLWDPITGQRLARIHEYALRIIEPVFPAFHPAKPILVTFCDKRKSMRVWEIDYSELLKKVW